MGLARYLDVGFGHGLQAIQRIRKLSEDISGLARVLWELWLSRPLHSVELLKTE